MEPYSALLQNSLDCLARYPVGKVVVRYEIEFSIVKGCPGRNVIKCEWTVDATDSTIAYFLLPP